MTANPAALQQLVDQWRRNPDMANTVVACRELAATDDQPKLVDEIGKRAAINFASQPDVLIEVARMYLGSSRLGDAQGLLVSAGKMSPKNPEVYRLLGEVLLRRGDAERAVKVLERAVFLGKDDEETNFWREQSLAFADLQRTSGPQAVVAELSAILIATGRPPIKPSSRPAARSTGAGASQQVGSVRPALASESDAVTVIRKPPTVTPERPPAVRPRAAPPPAELPRTGPAYAAPPSPFALTGAPAKSAGPITVPPPTPRPSQKAPLPRPPPVPSEELTAVARLPNTNAPVTLPATSTPLPAREVLSALAVAGVYEPGAAPPPTWDAPARPRSRFLLALAAITALLLASGVGVLKYNAHVRARKADEAQKLGDNVALLLEGGNIGDLARAEQMLSLAFELEPNSARTALLWVRDRVLRPLQVEGEAQGIDSAMNRARQTGVPEQNLAFARIGSFLAQGDTAGAAALLAQWDGPAKDDPYYQLLAGAALERAGDLRAIERYRAAVERAPKLIAAQIMLGRALLLEGDLQKGVESTDKLRAAAPDRVEPAALSALAWARRATRGPAPAEAETARTRRDELPLALRSIPAALDALSSTQPAEAESALERALAAANTPGLATWLGSVALHMGHEALARSAALQAVSFSAVYPPARVLAARLALAAGRLDEAASAVSELDASWPDVAIVRAAVAYEHLDPDGVTHALWTLPSDARQDPELAALVHAADVLRGNLPFDSSKLRPLASREVPWGELLMLDVALDEGNTNAAKELLDKPRDSGGNAELAVRRARYLRYIEHPQDADAASKDAVALGTARSLVERTLALVAAEKRDDARTLLSKQGAVAGTMAAWLSAYIEAKGPHASEARSKAGALEVPGPSAPLLYRIVAALALNELHDTKRGTELTRALSKQFPHNPDINAAGQR